MGQALKTRNELADMQPQEEQKLMKVKPAKEMPQAGIIEGREKVGEICAALKPVVAPFASKCPYPETAQFLNGLDWGGVERMHIAKDGNKFYSFAAEFEKSRRIVTVGIWDEATTLTVSDMKGTVLSHAMQRGGEVSYYSAKAA